MQTDLPKDFVSKMERLLGSESTEFFNALTLPAVKGVMVNAEKTEVFKKLADFKYTAVPKVENGYVVDSFKFSNQILSHLGVIYSQEPSAMYPVEMLDIRPGQIVLDLCSAPGGKSIQILNKLKGEGLLVANEIDYRRAQILYENLVRMGYKNFAITCNSPEDFEGLQCKFDRILVDAPCGGEGMMRRADFDMQSYKNGSIATNSLRQKSILISIANILKPDGILVYSTCTYDTTENEEVVADFLKSHSDYEIEYNPYFENVTTHGVKVGEFETDKTYRRYPHKFVGEGQYMAVLKRDKFNSDQDYTQEFQSTCGFSAQGFSVLYRKDMENINRMLKGIVATLGLTLAKRKESIYVLPDTTIDFGNLNVVSIGVLLGTGTFKDFKIAHNFYHCMGERIKNQVALDLENVQKYLQGYEIDNVNNPNGICAVTFEGTCLGGGKVVNGKLKNYYPKNLRNN